MRGWLSPFLVSVWSVGLLTLEAAESLRFQMRSRDPATGVLQIKAVDLDPARTAVVVIDLWDRHWCKTYTARVGELVPRMNATLDAARQLGMTIVHAPSDVVTFYADTPQRKTMLAVPASPPPATNGFAVAMPPWNQTGGCECGPHRPCTAGSAWTRQHPDLRIEPGDLIGDCNRGEELLNLCAARGIEQMLYVGVASNMCLCHRGFGLFNLLRHGYRGYFVHDLVQAISGNGYDPDRQELDPNFTPAAGTAHVQQYLERFVAPSLDSRQILTAAGKGAGDPRPHAVFVIADEEYRSEESLRRFAQSFLEPEIRCTFVGPAPDRRHDLPGIAAVDDADVVVLSLRRRFLPAPQMDHLERYLRNGRPLIALRVSVVAFAEGSGVTRSEDGQVVWQDFDREVLGCRYNFYDSAARQSGSDVWAVAPWGQATAALKAEPRFHSTSWIYRTQPLASNATVLWRGRWSETQPDEPVVWTRSGEDGRVFYTSLGHPDDFQQAAFQALLRDALAWALDPALREPE